MIKDYVINGKVYRHDTTAKTVTVDGATRPMTAEEAAVADESNSLHLLETNEQQLKSDLKVLLGTLKNAVGAPGAPAGTDSLNALAAVSNAAINSTPAPYIKALARIQKEQARALIKAIRLVTDSLDGTE